MESILDCPLYFVYDTKHDYYVEIYTDREMCENKVYHMNCYTKQTRTSPRYEVACSDIGRLLLDVKNANLG